MKKLRFLLLFTAFSCFLKAQVLFSDRFNGLTLRTYTTSASVTNYTTVGTGYQVINDTLKNNAGSFTAPNKPFQIPALDTTDWAVLYNSNVNDTFLVSTSWVDTALAVSRYVVTPMVNNITANTVLSWDAMAPDPNARDGYEVYVTNKTGTLTAADFAASDLIFSIADANIAGGGENSTWTRRSVSLGIYAGQNLRFAFRNISTNMYQLWIDNVTVENLPNSLDAAISQTVPVYKYNTVNTPGSITCSITNKGYTPISYVTMNYAIVGFSNQLETYYPNPVLSTYASGNYTFTVPYSISTPGYYKLKLWVVSVNGLNDQNHLNDTLVNYISVMSVAPPKNVLVEQFMSSKDGYGPDATTKLDSLMYLLSTSTSSVIGVNIHDNDSMSIPAAATLSATYMQRNSMAMIDRVYFPDVNSIPVERSTYTTEVLPRQTAIVPAKVSIVNKNFDTTSRVLTFTVQADFVSEVRGDYRIGAYVLENYVYGPPSGTATLTAADTSNNGWNQLNFMYTASWSPWFSSGSYSPPDNAYVLLPYQYYHKWVLDAAPDGVFGLSGGPIPTTGGTNGQSYTKVFSYTVPRSSATKGYRFHIDNMHVVGFVAEYDPDKNQRNILNCAREKVTAVAEGISEKVAGNSTFELYPNPSSGWLNILIPERAFRSAPLIRVTDLLGKEVYRAQTEISFGLIQMQLGQLAKGAYYISLESGDARATRKLLITE